MESEENNSNALSLAKKSLQNRWLWLAITLILLGASALTITQTIQQTAETQAEIDQAQKTLDSHVQLVENAASSEASLASCTEAVSMRIQQLDSFKQTLSVISAEYQNMYHAGIGNVNVDAYIDALNNVASITAVLDGQNLEVCDVK